MSGTEKMRGGGGRRAGEWEVDGGVEGWRVSARRHSAGCGVSVGSRVWGCVQELRGCWDGRPRWELLAKFLSSQLDDGAQDEAEERASSAQRTRLVRNEAAAAGVE
eukprot:253766-Rhodomonas_salina.3